MERDFDVPRFIARVRRLADLSQRDLAHQLGISTSRVARLEAGAAEPPVSLFRDILRTAGHRAGP